MNTILAGTCAATIAFSPTPYINPVESCVQKHASENITWPVSTATSSVNLPDILLQIDIPIWNVNEVEHSILENTLYSSAELIHAGQLIE